MRYEILRTSQFKKDYKLAVKRGCDIERLKKVVTLLASGETLPVEFASLLVADDADTTSGNIKMFKENYEEAKKLKDCAYFKAIGFRKMGVESGISLKDAVENKRIFCMMVLYYDPFSTEKFKVLSVNEYDFSEVVRLIAA